MLLKQVIWSMNYTGRTHHIHSLQLLLTLKMKRSILKSCSLSFFFRGDEITAIIEKLEAWMVGENAGRNCRRGSPNTFGQILLFECSSGSKAAEAWCCTQWMIQYREKQTYRQFRGSSLTNQHVFGLWEEPKNTQTHTARHSKQEIWSWDSHPGPSCCGMTGLTTEPSPCLHLGTCTLCKKHSDHYFIWDLSLCLNRLLQEWNQLKRWKTLCTSIVKHDHQ